MAWPSQALLTYFSERGFPLYIDEVKHYNLPSIHPNRHSLSLRIRQKNAQAVPLLHPQLLRLQITNRDSSQTILKMIITTSFLLTLLSTAQLNRKKHLLLRTNRNLRTHNHIRWRNKSAPLQLGTIHCQVPLETVSHHSRFTETK